MSTCVLSNISMQPQAHGRCRRQGALRRSSNFVEGVSAACLSSSIVAKEVSSKFVALSNTLT